MDFTATYTYTAPTCTHFRTPVPIGKHTIYVTAKADFWGQEKVFRAAPPDLFIGLADSWFPTFQGTLSTYGIQEKSPLSYEKPPCPYIIIDWPDRQGCPPRILPWLVQLVLKRLHNDQRVETGCIGGHGRTGTFLACLIGAEEKLSPYNAILTTRKRHCHKAIETMAQIYQIYTFLGSTIPQADLDFPPPPPAPVTPLTIEGSSAVLSSSTVDAVDKMTDAEWEVWFLATYGVKVTAPTLP